MGRPLEHAVHPQTRAHFEGIYRGADTALMGRVLVLSSSSIIRALLAADLLDELHVALLPAVLGTDRRLFPAGVTPATLRLIGTTTLPPGAVGLHCGR